MIAHFLFWRTPPLGLILVSHTVNYVVINSCDDISSVLAELAIGKKELSE